MVISGILDPGYITDRNEQGYDVEKEEDRDPEKDDKIP